MNSTALTILRYINLILCFLLFPQAIKLTRAAGRHSGVERRHAYRVVNQAFRTIAFGFLVVVSLQIIIYGVLLFLNSEPSLLPALPQTALNLVLLISMNTLSSAVRILQSEQKGRNG